MIITTSKETYLTLCLAKRESQRRKRCVGISAFWKVLCERNIYKIINN